MTAVFGYMFIGIFVAVWVLSEADVGPAAWIALGIATVFMWPLVVVGILLWVFGASRWIQRDSSSKE